MTSSARLHRLAALRDWVGTGDHPVLGTEAYVAALVGRFALELHLASGQTQAPDDDDGSKESKGEGSDGGNEEDDESGTSASANWREFRSEYRK